jgi:hypothetical protein
MRWTTRFVGGWGCDSGFTAYMALRLLTLEQL